jgi:hypothetical protein
MTRKDWWLGILVLLIALLIQTFVLVHMYQQANEVARTPRRVPTQALTFLKSN